MREQCSFDQFELKPKVKIALLCVLLLHLLFVIGRSVGVVPTSVVESVGYLSSMAIAVTIAPTLNIWIRRDEGGKIDS